MFIEVKGDMPFGCALQTQGINLFDDFSRILVHNQLVLILWVFDITVGSKGTNILAVAPLVVKDLTDNSRLRRDMCGDGG